MSRIRNFKNSARSWSLKPVHMGAVTTGINKQTTLSTKNAELFSHIGATFPQASGTSPSPHNNEDTQGSPGWVATVRCDKHSTNRQMRQ
jgi:hypothetical protein